MLIRIDEIQTLGLVSPYSSLRFSSQNRPRLSIPKSSYLLLKLAFPDFTRAASWDNISDSYNNQTSQLAMSSESHGRRAVFPYLIHLGLGVKYAEWFEMKETSHSVILRRKQAVKESKRKCEVYCRTLGVQ